MNEFLKRLTDCCRIDDFDLGQNDTVAQEVRTLYERKTKKAKIQCWLRLAACAAIVVYGALGIKYNTGWYANWALFTALVGVNGAFVIIAWYWQLDTKLTLLKEVKQLRIEINALARKEKGDESN